MLFILIHPTMLNLFLVGPVLIPFKVQIGSEVPAILSPIKPKFFLLGDVTLEAGCALKLK